MLTTHRKQQILSILKRDGQVIAKDVSRSMNVSEDTIRRDLREMAQEGLLLRVHGGALPASPAMADFAGRESITAEGKIGDRTSGSKDDSRGTRGDSRWRHDCQAGRATYSLGLESDRRYTQSNHCAWSWSIIATWR